MRNSKVNIYRGRTKLLLFIFLILVVLLTVRFFYLQIIKGDDLRNIRENNINAFEYIYPKRGRIISRDGIVLAEDRKVFSLAIDIEQKPSEQSIRKLTDLFSERINVEDLRLKVSDSIRFRRSEIIIEKLTQEDLAKYLVSGSDITGFSVIEGYERQYNSHPSIFHVLGHMGYINSSDVNYFSPRIDEYNSKLWSKVGKSGLERVYEQKLQGEHGKRFFQRNARGDRRVITDISPFREGEELLISIDFEAQKLAYDLMKDRKGSVVVIDLDDFSIPVAISTPSISANDLRDISTLQYQDLLNDPARPLWACIHLHLR